MTACVFPGREPASVVESDSPRSPRLGVPGRFLKSYPLGALGAAAILILIILGLTAPLVAPYDINEFAGEPGQPPALDHLFGTDKLGRDILSRVLYGARISLVVGFAAIALGGVAGTAIGLVSGYKPGVIDGIVQRFIDVMVAFPKLVLLLIVVRLLGPSMTTVVLAIAFGLLPSIVRVVRSAALSERSSLYVEAARASGAADLRILCRHLLPNIAPVVVVVATSLLGQAILAEAALSFLGLGIAPPNPSWGADVSQARLSFPLNTWSAFFPGAAITVSVLGFTLLGDALRDALDPKLRAARTSA